MSHTKALCNSIFFLACTIRFDIGLDYSKIFFPELCCQIKFNIITCIFKSFFVDRSLYVVKSLYSDISVCVDISICNEIWLV